jgi:hypothetical protein
MAKPDYVGWIPDNTTNIVEPPDGKKDAGWAPVEKPPAQYFNWLFNLLSQWVNFTGPGAPTVIVGSADYCTHATLAAAVADSGVGTNIRVLLTESANISSTISLTKAGWKIEALPGVTYTKSAVATGISVAAANIEISRLRMAAWSTGGDKAVAFAAGGTYGRVLYCNFSSCDTEVDDSAVVTVSQKPVQVGNITE